MFTKFFGGMWLVGVHHEVKCEMHAKQLGNNYIYHLFIIKTQFIQAKSLAKVLL